MKKKNPVIENARKDGYEKGFKVGVEHGRQIGIQQATGFIEKRFLELDKVPGIGPKTVEKFVKAFGEDYFVKVDEGGSSFEKKEAKKVDRQEKKKG